MDSEDSNTAYLLPSEVPSFDDHSPLKGPKEKMANKNPFKCAPLLHYCTVVWTELGFYLARGVQLSPTARKAQLEVYRRIADSRGWDKIPADVHFLSNPNAFQQVMTEHAKIKQRELASAARVTGEAGSPVSNFVRGFGGSALAN